MRSTDLGSLPSLRDPRLVAGLRSMAIVSITDLAEYPAFRHADLVIGLDRNDADGKALLRGYLRPTNSPPATPIPMLQVSALRTLTADEARRFREVLRLRTIGEVASWPPYREALAMVQRAARAVFREPPSAPEALIPTLIGSTHTASRFSNYVKDQVVTISNQSLVTISPPDGGERRARNCSNCSRRKPWTSSWATSRSCGKRG